LSEGPLISVFGPTGSGKTAVAIELAGLLRDRGEDPVAVNCDSIQVYRGLEVLSGAADALGQDQLEHRLISFVPVEQEFSAARYATLARAEIDGLIDQGKRPILVGGTGLYLRGALSSLEFRPPVAPEVRAEVEREIGTRGPAALHAELSERARRAIDPNDRSRVTRATELLRSGQEPAADHEGGGELWTAKLRYPSLLVGLTDEPGILTERIGLRVETMAAAGAGEEAARAVAADASRTARAAIGFKEFLSGDLERAATRHRQFARRQMTWMRKMEAVTVVERSERSDRVVAASILELAGKAGSDDASRRASG